jgi:hypothetical protein
MHIAGAQEAFTFIIAWERKVSGTMCRNEAVKFWFVSQGN